MTQAEEPPGLALPAYKMQELAQLVWLATAAMRRYQQHRENRDRDQQRRAAREVLAAKDAIRGATGDPAAATDEVPRPIDSHLFEQANQLATQQAERSAQVVSLAPLGRSTWAVTGEVPGVGRVGSEVATQAQAEAVREMILTAPASELGAFSLAPEQTTLERRYLREDERARVREEYPAMVREMNPDQPQDRALARNLLGRDQRLDEAIVARFGSGLTGEAAAAEAEQARQQEQAATALAAAPVETPVPGAEVPQTGPAESPVPAPPEPQAPPVVRESLPGPAGRRYNRIDVNEAMRLYPEPDPSQQGMTAEYRDSTGRLLDPEEYHRDLVDAIPSWDPTNAEHRRFAAELYGQDEAVDAALRNRFEGIDTAMRAHAQRRAAVARQEAEAEGRAAVEHEQDAARNAEVVDDPVTAADEKAEAEVEQGQDEHDAQVERARQAAANGTARQAGTENAGVALAPPRGAKARKAAAAGPGGAGQQGAAPRRSQQQGPRQQRQR